MAHTEFAISAINSIPLLFPSKPYFNARVRVSSQPKTLSSLNLNKSQPYGRSFSSTRLNAAGLSEIEPDLSEEQGDPWATNGVSPDEFLYGIYDGAHTYHERPYEGTFWSDLVSEYEAAEPPAGFQGLMSWLFLPAMFAGLVFHVPGEYLYIGAAVFVVIFCAIEMGKPDKPHNFEPQIYNMERSARDKLIEDYNTMDIWDFNEKYGDLWDFTVTKDSKAR